MPTRNQAQLALDETVVEDPELEKMLDERQKRKDSMTALRLQYEEADKLVAGRIAQLELTEGAVRVGRWRIEKVHVPARRVEAFDTTEKDRVKIDLAEDGE